jgi:2-phosphosulfolactate phosphatase
MTVTLNLEFTARDAVQAVRRKDLIVVIDVLRCTSSILNAYANGAEKVIPTKTLAEAYRLHREHPSFLLAGERGGVRPRGFDLGNSPLEFTRQRVYGKTLILTTTSGTAALSRSRQADRVLIGAFLNASSVAKAATATAETHETGISIVLSGRKGHFSLEDFLCGGAIAEQLLKRKADLSDSSFGALLAFRRAKNRLYETIMTGEHARHLRALGFEEDVRFSCQLDLYSIVPVYKDGSIELPR